MKEEKKGVKKKTTNLVPVAISQILQSLWTYRDRERATSQQCSRIGQNDPVKPKQFWELKDVHSCYGSALKTAFRAPSSTH